MKTKMLRYFIYLTILSLFIVPVSAFAESDSPFVGHWEAIDVDGSDIRLTIAGPPNGPFKITSTESYISFCGGEAGIVKGTGWLVEGNPYILEADLLVTCFKTGESWNFQVTWVYDLASDTIAYPVPDPVILTWHRPGHPLPWAWRTIIAHPDQEWVEGGGYDEGTVVSMRIYDAGGTLLFGETATASYRQGDPYFWVEFNVGYDLKAGDHLWMTDGKIAKDLILTNLQITETSLIHHTVSGIAEPRSEVILEYFPEMFSVTADKDGIWTAIVEGLAIGIPGLASQEDADGDLTRVVFEVPNPFFTVFPDWEYIEGWNWEKGANVHLEIDDPATLDSPDYGQDELVVPTPWDPNQYWVTFNFDGTYDMKPGDIVSLSDGVTTRTHTVQNLSITNVDKNADTITGTADEGVVVYVWPHDAWFEALQATPGLEGTWQVNLGEVGYDILEGTAGRSEIRDELGNSTAVDWWVPIPRFTVFPEWEFFDGLDWPDGAIVSISVEGKSECDLEVASWGGFFNGNFPEGCDVAVGDKVTFSDGSTTRTHIVRNLAITAVDKEGDTISGTADPGTVVYVWPHDGWFEALQATADESGVWQVDLGEVGYDILEGAAGRSEIRDELGNATAVDWYVPNPRFTVFPEWEWFDGLDWPDGVNVSISVDGKSECSTASLSWGGFFNGPFPEACDVVTGDTVVFEDGVTTRTHTVQNLSITGVDLEADTVAGTAYIGALVYAWVHEYGETEMQLTVEDGTWLADFGSNGFDLQEGMCGRAEIRDGFGNSTAVDWCIPP